VVIGLAVTREGIPVRVWVWPGNTNDQTVITQVKDDLRGWRLGRCVWVVDRGFSSDENLRSLTRAGGHWIAGERMRDGSPDAQAALARPGRYQTVRDNLRVKDVGEGDNAGRGRAATRPSATRTSPGSRLSSRGSNRPAEGEDQQGPYRRRAERDRAAPDPRVPLSELSPPAEKGEPAPLVCAECGAARIRTHGANPRPRPGENERGSLQSSQAVEGERKPTWASPGFRF
jgi:Transposase DDE domain